MITALILTALFLEARVEAELGDRHGWRSWFILSSTVLVFTVLGFVLNKPLTGILYLGWRFVLFDYAFNLFRGSLWDYRGITSPWDRWLTRVGISSLDLLAIRIIILTLLL